MDNEELDGVKFSEFPSQTPGNSDEVVGLHSGDNARFSIANIVAAVRNGLASIFVPLTRTINGKALNTDISIDASDVGAVDTADVGVADGVASLDSTGKVPSSQLPTIPSDAADIIYDPTTSGLTATDVQAAVDEVVDDLDGKQPSIIANGILKGDGAGGVSAATAGTDYQAPLTAGTDYATPAQLANKEDKFYQPGDTIDCSAYPYLVGMTAGSGSNLRLTLSVYTPKTNGLNLNISHNLTAAWIRGEGNQYSGSIPQNAVSVSGNWLFISIFSTSLPALRVLVAAIGGTITFS